MSRTKMDGLVKYEDFDQKHKVSNYYKTSTFKQYTTIRNPWNKYTRNCLNAFPQPKAKYRSLVSPSANTQNPRLKCPNPFEVKFPLFMSLTNEPPVLSWRCMRFVDRRFPLTWRSFNAIFGIVTQGCHNQNCVNKTSPSFRLFWLCMMVKCMMVSFSVTKKIEVIV